MDALHFKNGLEVRGYPPPQCAQTLDHLVQPPDLPLVRKDQVLLVLHGGFEFRDLPGYLNLVFSHDLLHEVFHFLLPFPDLHVYPFYLLFQVFHPALPLLYPFIDSPYVLIGRGELLPYDCGFHEFELVLKSLVLQGGVPVPFQLLYDLLLLLEDDFGFPHLLLHLFQLFQRLVPLIVVFRYPRDLVYYPPPLEGVHVYYLRDISLPDYVMPSGIQSRLREDVEDLLACRDFPVYPVGGNAFRVQPPGDYHVLLAQG